MNIYVGNLPYTVRNAELRSVFEKYGAVDDAEVVVDRRTNRSRGYGFVRMKNPDEARAAIKALNGYEFQGRKLRVDESKPKDEDEARDRRGPRDSKRDAQSARPKAESSPATATAPEPGGLLGFFKRLFR